MPFQFEEALLCRQAAPEPRERAVGSDHTMTGNDDGNRIAADGPADGPDGFGTGDRPGATSP